MIRQRAFPRLVAMNAAFYGYQMKGYWCDIGTLNQYRLANYDVLKGLVKIDIPGSGIPMLSMSANGQLWPLRPASAPRW